MPSTFLSLPREIRDQIIGHVICFHVKSSPDPAHDAPLRTSSDGALRLPKLSPRTYNALGLLGTNLQIKRETKNCLKRLDPPYSLDVMVVDDEIWPTWTCCPLRQSSAISKVNVSLRFFSKKNDPYMVQVARMCRVILQGRKWTCASMHPLAELFQYICHVCLQPDLKAMNRIKSVCFDLVTADDFDAISRHESSGSLSNLKLKSLFGKHRSLWNSFRSIHQYPSSRHINDRRLASSLKIMLLLMLQEAWDEECAIYATYVGQLGNTFRSAHTVQFKVNTEVLEQLIAVN